MLMVAGLVKTPLPRLPIGMLALLVASIAIWSSAEAQVYQWKDSDGRTVYSDTPPPGVAAKQVSKPGAPTSPPTPSKKDEPTNKGSGDKEKGKSEDANRATAEKQQALVEYCTAARERLAQLDSGQRIALVDRYGERSFMSDDQRSSEMLKLIADMRQKQCP